MTSLTEIAIAQAVAGVFTRTEVALWLGGSSDRQFSMLARAIAAGEVLRVHRGLYCLAPRYLRDKVDTRALAQRIYGPSYLSLETALAWHGWIPEAVYAITSVCLQRSCEFDTPLGRFSFTRVPQKALYVEVLRVEQRPAENFLIATPLKALADYVYVHKRDWRSARPVVESLRVDERSLAELKPEAFDRLTGHYTSRRVHRFLEGLRKDLIP